VNNSWSALQAVGVPTARSNHSAVWTGSEMIVCGGWNGSATFNDTYVYSPPRLMYLYQRP